MGLELHLKHADLDAKLCARQLLHIQSPDRKFSGAEPPDDAAPEEAAAALSPPALRCLHLKHADLEAKLCARQPVQIQSPGRKLPAVGPPAGSGALDPKSPEAPDPKLGPPPPEPPALAFLHLKHTLRDAKLCAWQFRQVQSPGRRTPPPPPAGWGASATFAGAPPEATAEAADEGA